MLCAASEEGLGGAWERKEGFWVVCDLMPPITTCSILVSTFLSLKSMYSPQVSQGCRSLYIKGTVAQQTTEMIMNVDPGSMVNLVTA